ncbi:hypothetical protein PC9H_001766 [Pleurotus ostreatus]|uniref:Uncharacterized protein n=1 Tax=Pleurotus ostreatus TaxID=5322 RepID=A0A8H7DMH6_PLEOS|nr:uncharacterized protein PC9H_001766 [Pleurotus ostreatus]KAF7419182.1 hypothetical protein PC9H_001766 [Pleurotus ostreatus]
MPADRSPKNRRQRRSRPYQSSPQLARRSTSAGSARGYSNSSALMGFNDVNGDFDTMMDVDVVVDPLQRQVRVTLSLEDSGAEYPRPGHHVVPQQGQQQIEGGEGHEEHHRGWWMLLLRFFFVVATTN